MNELIDSLFGLMMTRDPIDFDPVRRKYRVEIPAALLSVAVTRSDVDQALIDRLCQHVLDSQTPDGYWCEFSYEPDEEDPGCYGAVATCFAGLSLCLAYERRPSSTVLDAIIRCCDYVYSVERNGYFLKSTINKTDVINTNLFCAVLLLMSSRLLNEDSRRLPLYRDAAKRAVIRACSAQLMSGAFPYTTVGFQVPYLYHLMSQALLEMCASQIDPSPSVHAAILRGRRFTDRVLDTDFRVRWGLEKHPEKSGASWAYAWAYACFVQRGDADTVLAFVDWMQSLASGGLLANEGESEEDPFYTAWSLMALTLGDRASVLDLRYRFSIVLTIRKIVRYWLRVGYVLKYVVNRYVFGRFDRLGKGPVEYW